MTSYQYVNNNPVNLIDPTRMEAGIVFNTKTAQLLITDLDHYKAGLNTVYVSVKDHKFGGIRDFKANLTHNQTLVINDVFSDGTSRSGSSIGIAHIGGSFSAFYDKKTREGEISLIGQYGLGLPGFKYGLFISNTRREFNFNKKSK